MSDMNRRHFLIASAATAAVMSLPVLNDDAGNALAVDAPTTKPGAGIDVGALKSFGKDGITDTFSNKGKGEFFVIRDGGKLFASSSICTHKSCVLKKGQQDLRCSCHRSQFSIQGTAQSGPAKGSLVRYAISSDAAGKVLVDKSRSFTEKQWDDAGSFIKVDGAPA